jgi:hypothetical protein
MLPAECINMMITRINTNIILYTYLDHSIHATPFMFDINISMLDLFLLFMLKTGIHN